jgi:serine/threonine protein kinase
MSDVPSDAKGIFLAALDVADPAERVALVRRLCADDAALLQRVDDLLRAYGQSNGPLDKLAAALATTQVGQPIREQVGSTIGPYKLMEQIGEGGFGLVFVAEQQQPIRRKVALKIIKPGMDTRDVIARFEAERQALALMDHPNIARVLDAGTTDSGRPYFVMELVRGVPITEYCDQTQLTPAERLPLFVDVCNAVQHAHQKGIIHRDIKPSNVLVTLHDDRPVVKVIDFGVAKALYQPLTDRTIYTRFAQMIGTPLYMSPEQAQMSGLDIDTRSDIYSLGVLFYELLTGTTPLDKRRVAQAAYDELLKIIREDEPPKPSLRLSQSGDALPSIAAQRKTEPAKLSKMFSGDLDWITMKALEKDRTRRYETANALAADVLRYLNDEPVEASPPSAGYRLRKFARKYRGALVTAGSFVGLLVAAVVVTSWLAIVANRARTSERIQREIAVAERNRAIGAEAAARNSAAIAERRSREAEAARNMAERQFANGLLRPIGFSDQTTAAERHSFVDWSAIKESQLKSRVLEIALDNSETALRVARRADSVIQSCVGLSPKRRAKAIKLVSSKQRDLTANPRIRVAACWLALELGSADLPAFEQSCIYLSDPKNRFVSESDEYVDWLNEFVVLTASRSDPQQIAQLNLDPLIATLEKSTGDFANFNAWIAPLSPRLDKVQVDRAGDALIAILQKSNDDSAVWTLQGLAALAPRLNQSQVNHAADALIGMVQNSVTASQTNSAISALRAMAPRLDAGQANRAWDALTAKKWFGQGDEIEFALAPRLNQSQAIRAGETMIAMLVSPKEDSVPQNVSAGLEALAPRLEAAQVERLGDALIAILRGPARQLTDVDSALKAIARRMDASQAKRAWDALTESLEKSDEQSDFNSKFEGLAALAVRLNEAQIDHAADALIVTLEGLKGQHLDQHLNYAVSRVLISLAPRLREPQVSHAVDNIIPIMEKSRDDYGLFAAASDGLVALAPRLALAQAKRAGEALIAIVQKSKDSSLRHQALQALGELAPRLDASQTKRAWRALMATRTDEGILFRWSEICGALGPQVDASEAKRAWDALMATFAKRSSESEYARTVAGLAAVAPRLESASRDVLSTNATTFLLDYWTLSRGPGGMTSYVYLADPIITRIARSISTPRSLAKLLSHPGCVAQVRQGFLERFEELVFYDGKPVFFRAENPDAKQSPHEQTPPRRFHNLHDAAAWIQQNWPDFDLETNCPLTWRGSR